MAKRNRYSTEQIIHKLRDGEVMLAKGQNVAEMCKQRLASLSRPVTRLMFAWCRSQS